MNKFCSFYPMHVENYSKSFIWNWFFVLISSGVSPYFSSLGSLFILIAEFKIIFLGEFFSFYAFSFDILVFSSLIFCSSAKGFTSTYRCSKLFYIIHFIQIFIFTCWNSLKPHKLIFSWIFYLIVESVFLNASGIHTPLSCRLFVILKFIVRLKNKF